MLKRWLGRAAAPRSGSVPGPDLAARRRFMAGHILIHTHVPKTAGATLATGLAAIVGGVRTLDLRLQRTLSLDGLGEADLAGLSLVTGHFAYGLHARFPGRRPLYFAAVREPADRTVSNYRSLAGHPGNEDAAAHDFETWESLHRERRPNEQSRMLLGAAANGRIDPAEVIEHVAHAYFLVIPQPHMSRAIEALNTAFGIPWTGIADSNVSVGNEIVLDVPTRQAIRAANPADLELYEHVLETFEERLARACEYIALNCLEQPAEPAEDAAGCVQGG